MAKIWKNRASLSSHNISQNLHRHFTSIVCDILLVSYLFLGGSFAFKLYAFHQQLLEHLKVQNFMDQHNFEMIHFKCTIPVLLCYADSWFDFGI